MIGPEDIQETPKTNYTPMLVLGIAALLLLIVGFISYRDYVNAKADEKLKTSDERIKKLEEKIANLNNGSTPANTLGAAPTIDPQYEEMRRQLLELKQQNSAILKQTEENKLKAQENSLKVNRVLDAGPGAPTGVTGLPNMASIPPPSVRDDLTVPDYIRDSVASPPGGYRSPAVQANLTELQRKVKSAPSIGKIISYDEGWNLITIGAGKSNGIAIGQRYSVRRGSEVLGVVKIFEVFSSQANANIVTDNRKFDGALKPKVGDDIISFDPF